MRLRSTDSVGGRRVFRETNRVDERMWPVTRRRLGQGTDARWITGHMLAAQLSWVRGKPTTFGEAASFVE